MDKYYISPPPSVCDLARILPGAHDDIAKKGEFVDGRTQMGSWANMCLTCHRKHGVGLGTGKGQRYTRQADGRWLKTGG